MKETCILYVKAGHLLRFSLFPMVNIPLQCWNRASNAVRSGHVQVISVSAQAPPNCCQNLMFLRGSQSEQSPLELKMACFSQRMSCEGRIILTLNHRSCYNQQVYFNAHRFFIIHSLSLIWKKPDITARCGEETDVIIINNMKKHCRQCLPNIPGLKSTGTFKDYLTGNWMNLQSPCI